MSASAWRAAGYALAAALTCGIAACIWGVPLSLSDNLVLLMEVQRTDLGTGVAERFHTSAVLRPFYWAQVKLLFDLSAGHYFLTFKLFHIAQFAASAWLFVRLLRVRDCTTFVALAFALVVLFGLHTFIGTVREGPFTVPFACVAAAALAFEDWPSPWRDAAAVLMLVYAAFFVEIGLLVWVIGAAAWLVGCRGISGRGVAAMTAVVVLYFGLRFLVLEAGAPPLAARGTGFGFAPREPAEIIRLFGERPLVFYAYNVAASVMSVLLAEPRQGMFIFVGRWFRGELAPWLWINVITSTVTTFCLAWFLAHRAPAWGRREFTREDRLVLIFLAVLAANAVISYPYSRDVVMSPAGVFYAIATFAVMSALLRRLDGMRASRRLAVTLVLTTLGAGWCVRTIGLTYVLRETAFVKRNDWATPLEWLEHVDAMPAEAASLALTERLRQEALNMPVPNPSLAQPWAERYFDRLQ